MYISLQIAPICPNRRHQFEYNHEDKSRPLLSIRCDCCYHSLNLIVFSIYSTIRKINIQKKKNSIYKQNRILVHVCITNLLINRMGGNGGGDRKHLIDNFVKCMPRCSSTKFIFQTISAGNLKACVSDRAFLFFFFSSSFFTEQVKR